MQKARHKRKVLNNPNRIPEHKNAKITQKYKNVIPIPSKNQNLRKKESLRKRENLIRKKCYSNPAKKAKSKKKRKKQIIHFKNIC